MPGKQLSIDADLNAGLIDENEARARRKSIETEADFYGAMDGASKFVKGDAIAAIIIMLVNIIGGFVIGVLQRGLDLSQALQTYVLLTIGAGLAFRSGVAYLGRGGLIVPAPLRKVRWGKEHFAHLSNFNVQAVAASSSVCSCSSPAAGDPLPAAQRRLGFLLFRRKKKAQEYKPPHPRAGSRPNRYARANSRNGSRGPVELGNLGLQPDPIERQQRSG
jgi:flagellar biosynthesis protein FlhA